MKANKKTCGDRLVKTTINLRKKMMLDVHNRMAELGKEDLIDYLRDLIHLDVSHRILGTFDPMSLTEFQRSIGLRQKMSGKEAIERISRRDRKNACKDPRPYFGPPKKFPGFITGERGRNYWPVLQWVRQRTRQWEEARRCVDGEMLR